MLGCCDISIYTGTYFLNIDISILNFSMYRNIEKYRFFDKQLLFNSCIYDHHNVF